MTMFPGSMPRALCLGFACALMVAACGGKDEQTKSDSGTGAGDDSGTSAKADSGVDMGGPRPDAGTMARDGGMSDSGIVACRQNTDCSGPTPVCGSFDQDQNIVPCTGGTCFCFNSCAYETPAMGCPAGERCAFAGEGSTIQGRGVCSPATGGALQGADCTSQYDNNAQKIGDTCETGLVCRGTVPDFPMAQCAQACLPGNNATCAALGAYSCVPFRTGSTFGYCLSAPPANLTDVGASCTPTGANMNCAGGGCAAVNLVAGTTVGSCTSDCSGVNSCPSDSFCATGLCYLQCTPGNNAPCTAKNAASVCQPLGTNFGLCLGKCTANTDCVNGLGLTTCNVATGVCQ